MLLKMVGWVTLIKSYLLRPYYSVASESIIKLMLQPLVHLPWCAWPSHYFPDSIILTVQHADFCSSIAHSNLLRQTALFLHFSANCHGQVQNEHGLSGFVQLETLLLSSWKICFLLSVLHRICRSNIVLVLSGQFRFHLPSVLARNLLARV